MANLTMIDFAYPVSPPPVKTDIVLVYCGGDTPHVMTSAEMEAQPAQFRLPTFVRSNPTGAAQAQSDASAFIAWLNENKVPKGITVLLDLEIAVNAAYVTSFNNALDSAGYRVMKYGSLDYIFKNPKTSGGTFVADPTGKEHMVTEGDTVATQYLFSGTYDLSVVLPTVPLWNTKPVTIPDKPAFDTPKPVSSYDLRVSWPAIDGAESYHYEVVNRQTGKVMIDDNTSSTSFELTELSDNVWFEYRVAAHETSTHLASRWSDWVSVQCTT